MNRPLNNPAGGPVSPLAPIRKALVPVLALLGQLVAFDVLHGDALHVAVAVLAAATALGVYTVPNGPAVPPVSPLLGPDDEPVMTAPPVRHRTARGR